MAEKNTTKSILDKYPEYEINIGMEVHVQLNTDTKIFCPCPNRTDNSQNTNICEICSGYPGVLPVLNKKVVESAILAGLATNCKIAELSTFARKHYFYPDLPKNYQITQDDKPICSEGHLNIRFKDRDGKEQTKKIRLLRIHIEEDAGKNIHAHNQNISLVNLNRAGTPLLEAVTYPDISSAEETKAYLKMLRGIVQTLGICSGNMEEGAFRADTNISVRKKGAKELGTRCELKNINSFKFIADAIEYETARQIKLLEAGEKVIQQTRLWDTKNKKSVVMRSKEEAADYRYFQDPDLPLIEVGNELLSRAESKLPELPEAKFLRFQKEFGLSSYEADVLIDEPAIAKYFEEARHYSSSKQIINFVLRDIMGLLKEQKITISQCKVTPQNLAELADLIDSGVINSNAAKIVFEKTAETGSSPAIIVDKEGLKQIGSEDEIIEIAKEILAANPAMVEQYKAGKDKLFGFFVGQMMQKTKGRGNPKTIQKVLKDLLS